MADLSRDLRLVSVWRDVWNTVAGNAAAAIAIMKNRFTDRSYERVRAVEEMLVRYEALVMAVAPSMAEYRDDMTEAELRVWAATLVNDVL